ncbi:tRNA lysidine(34) synthetase TilS [Pararhizobium sp.]|uniref:tRNA lysidine(34) synthetase TilS n=1 Tax=Pararhizobium sp. TaxID=1977563 RepID=UPI002728D99B|nr:tRNA lysidine(34) synthetase TilS [Pararhizobium sp.]MDO9415102.1 tRNA lysidine(34) synthetase TilS [Pararhizobium sp.]
MIPGLSDDAVLDTAMHFLNSFEKPGRLLVAVSGGSDSTGLLLALAKAAAESAFSLSACTIDHALRPGSASEADAVAALCQRLGIAHTVRRWEGEKPRTGIMAAARLARYRLLSDAAQEADALCVVTGHTLDDQHETLAMRRERTTDPRSPGLSGMADAVLFERRCWVLRPCLELERAEIRNFLVRAGEGWSDDPSNSNNAFERVRVRELLAGSGRNGRPAGTAVERGRASQRIAGLLAEHVVVHGGLAAEIGPGLFQKAGDPDCLRAILMLAAVLGGRAYPAGGDTAQRVRAFLNSGEESRITAARVVFDRRRGGLYLYREARGLAALTLAPGETGIWDGRWAVDNRSGRSAVVSAPADMRPVAAALAAGGLAEPIAKRAATSALQVSQDGLPVSPEAANIGVECHLAAYDTFLPGFDRIMANQIAFFFARSSYPAPPCLLFG